MKIFNRKPLFAFCLAGMAIVLTLTLNSFKSNLPDEEPDSPCKTREKIGSTDAQIQINFDATSFNFARASNYQGYIPNPDLRFSGGTPAGSMAEYTKYYCVITVTTPQCLDWVWEQALDSNNSNGTGKVNIKIPPASEGWDSTIEVIYFEIHDFPHTGIDFNYPNNPLSVRYSFEQTYQGPVGTNVPQPITLYADGLWTRDPYAGGGKGFKLSDYGTVNEYLMNN